MELIDYYGDQSEDNKESNSETELHLVLLLNQLSKRLCEREELLECIRLKSVFPILMRYLHDNGDVGQLARDAILHLVSLKSALYSDYIVEESNFCPLLATGLSGLYSSLPRRLPDSLVNHCGFHRLDSMSSHRSNSELNSFLCSLEFCDAVIENANDNQKLRKHLVSLIYMGFLVPVLVPALTQVSRSWSLI